MAWFNAGYRSGTLGLCGSVFGKEHAMPRIPTE
jgi:hypothetical protein